MYINFLEYKYKNSNLNEINEYKNLNFKTKKKNLKNLKKLKKLNVFSKLFKKRGGFFDYNKFYLKKSKKVTLNYKNWKKNLKKLLNLKIKNLIVFKNIPPILKKLTDQKDQKDLYLKVNKYFKAIKIKQNFKKILKKKKLNYKNYIKDKIIKKIIKKSKWKIFNFFIKSKLKNKPKKKLKLWKKWTKKWSWKKIIKNVKNNKKIKKLINISKKKQIEKINIKIIKWNEWKNLTKSDWLNWNKEEKKLRWKQWYKTSNNKKFLKKKKENWLKVFKKFLNRYKYLKKKKFINKTKLFKHWKKKIYYKKWKKKRKVYNPYRIISIKSKLLKFKDKNVLEWHFYKKKKKSKIWYIRIVKNNKKRFVIWFKLKNHPKFQYWKNVLFLNHGNKKIFEVFKFRTRSLLNKFKWTFYSTKENFYFKKLFNFRQIYAKIKYDFFKKIIFKYFKNLFFKKKLTKKKIIFYLKLSKLKIRFNLIHRKLAKKWLFYNKHMKFSKIDRKNQKLFSKIYKKNKLKKNTFHKKKYEKKKKKIFEKKKLKFKKKIKKHNKNLIDLKKKLFFFRRKLFKKQDNSRPFFNKLENFNIIPFSKKYVHLEDILEKNSPILKKKKKKKQVYKNWFKKTLKKNFLKKNFLKKKFKNRSLKKKRIYKKKTMLFWLFFKNKTLRKFKLKNFFKIFLIFFKFHKTLILQKKKKKKQNHFTNKKFFHNFFWSIESKLNIFLIRIGFLKNLNQSNFFIKKNMIFLNHKNNLKNNFLIKQNDLIQMSYFLNHYLSIYNKNFSNLKIFSLILKISQKEKNPFFLEMNRNIKSCIILFKPKPLLYYIKKINHFNIFFYKYLFFFLKKKTF